MKYVLFPMLLMLAPVGPAPGRSSADAELLEVAAPSFTADDEEAACQGCGKDRKPIVANPAHLSVPYQLMGRGFAELTNKSGSCKNPDQDPNTGDCVAVACKLEGTLKIKNNSTPGSSGRPITIRVRRGTLGPADIVQPGQSTTVTFGDPVAGTPEEIACGSSVSLEISSFANSGGTQVATTRTITWICTSCGRGRAGNQDPTDPPDEEEPEPTPVAFPEDH